MSIILKFLYLVAVALWSGSTFSALIGPRFFSLNLPGTARTALKKAVSLYYIISYSSAGTIFLVWFIGRATNAAFLGVGSLPYLMLPLIMFVGTLYSGGVVYPQLAHLKEEIASSSFSMETHPLRPKYVRLERLFRQLTFATCLAGALLLFICSQALVI